MNGLRLDKRLTFTGRRFSDFQISGKILERNLLLDVLLLQVILPSNFQRGNISMEVLGLHRNIVIATS